MIKDNFYVFTGGPGGGKTTLLQLLAQQGLACIPEHARQIIKQRLAAGLPPRPAASEFAWQIFEADMRSFTNNASNSNVLLFDRSFMDSACMLHDASLQLYKNIRPFIEQSRFNNTVFITPPWKEIYVTDTERSQTFEEAVNVYNRVYAWYKSHGYTLVQLPKAPVAERAVFVKQHIFS